MLNILKIAPDKFEVWFDPDDVSVRTGVCIGSGHTREMAIANAQVELVDHLNTLVSKPPKTIRPPQR